MAPNDEEQLSLHFATSHIEEGHVKCKKVQYCVYSFFDRKKIWTLSDW